MNEEELRASKNDAYVLFIGASPQMLPHYRQKLRDEFAALCPGMTCLMYAATNVTEASSLIPTLSALGVVCFCNEGRPVGEDSTPDARLLARLLNEHAGKPWVVLGLYAANLEPIFVRAGIDVRPNTVWQVLKERYADAQ